MLNKTQVNDIMIKMKNIDYGWKDKNGEIHYDVDETFADSFIFQSPAEVLNNKVGICWEQVELERELFQRLKISFNTYFIVSYDNDKCPTHTFLIFNTNNKHYWFEHSWEKFRGIHEYNKENDALKDIKEKFINHELNNEYNPMNLCIYKYDKPKYDIGCLDFYKHCEKGKKIKIE